jgi:hypothetical protein
MHNLDEKGFLYAMLSQLNPEKWGGNKLEVKDDVMHYRNDHELHVYTKYMIDKVAYHNRGIQMRHDNTHIGQQGLYFVSKDFKKIILLFDSRSTSRGITINFPEGDIHPLFIKEGTYDNPIS